jgi:hypothetical protein
MGMVVLLDITTDYGRNPYRRFLKEFFRTRTSRIPLTFHGKTIKKPRSFPFLP